MRLPALSLIVASQLVIWCVAGAIVHGWAILLYPLSWALIGAAFYWHNKTHPVVTSVSEAPDEAPKKWANSKTAASPGVANLSQDDAVDPQVATAD